MHDVPCFFRTFATMINIIPMNKRLYLLAAMVLTAACVLAQPLRQDATIRKGQLKNGMTRKNLASVDWLTFWNTWLLMVRSIFLARVRNWALCPGVRPLV